MRVVIECEGVHVIRHKMADGSIKEYHYAWRGGPRMKSEPGTPAYVKEHSEYLEKRDGEAPEKKTLGSLIDHFTGPEDRRNPDFLALADKTQKDHLASFKLIRKRWPKMPARLTQQRGMKREIREWHRSFSKNPRKADKLLFSLSKVFTYAVKDELVTINPCTGIDRLYAGTRRNVIWSPEQIRSIKHCAPPHLLLPFLIALETGQRQADILSRKWTDFDGTHLCFAQAKSKGAVRRRILLKGELLSMILALKEQRRHAKVVSAYICTNSRGKKWSTDGFKTSWGKLQKKYGIEGVTFHDLRGTFITKARREGSNASQIATVSGHAISEVRSVLEAHYLAEDQEVSDAVILRMK